MGLVSWVSRVAVPFYTSHQSLRHPELDARLSFLLPRALGFVLGFSILYWIINLWTGHAQSVVDRGDTLVFYEKPFSTRFWNTCGWALCGTAVLVLISCSLLLDWVAELIMLLLLVPFFVGTLFGMLSSNDRLHVDMRRRLVESRAWFGKPNYELSFDDLRLLEVEKQAPRSRAKQAYHVILRGRALPVPLGVYSTRKEALQFVSRLKSVAGAARNLPSRSA